MSSPAGVSPSPLDTELDPRDKLTGGTTTPGALWRAATPDRACGGSAGKAAGTSRSCMKNRGRSYLSQALSMVLAVALVALLCMLASSGADGGGVGVSPDAGFRLAAAGATR